MTLNTNQINSDRGHEIVYLSFVADNMRNDYFIFGYTGQETVPETRAPFFRVGNGQLRKDDSITVSTVPNDVRLFDFTELLSPNEYAQVDDLQASIPAELLGQNNASVGNEIPDAGYIDVRASINGKSYRWYLESDQTASSPAIREFVRRLRTCFK